MILTVEVTISLPYIGILATLFILAPLICTIVTLETDRHATRASRKKMKVERDFLNAYRVRVLGESQTLDEAKWDFQEEKRALHERELELGRTAHDVAVQTKLAIHQTADDTVIALPKWED